MSMSTPARNATGALILLLLFSGCAEERRLSTSSPEALAAYSTGVDAWTMFYYSEAEKAFRLSIAADSGFAMAWARLGMLGFMTDNEEQARVSIARAVALSGSASRHEQLFIRAWNHRIGFASEAAARTVDTLLAEYDDAEAHVLRGELQELNRDIEGAILSYGRALEADSTCARAAMMLGYAYSTLDRQKEALAWMERYIRLVPGAADPRASYADLLLRVGRYEEALEQYRASLQVKPDYWYSFTQIGTIYQILGRLRAAREEFLTGMGGLPQSPSRDADMLAVDGTLAMLRADYAGAEDLYRKALQIDSLHLTAASGLAYSFARRKNFDAAWEVTRSIGDVFTRRNLGPTVWMFRYNLMRADLFLEQGLLDSAEAACEDAFDRSSPLTRPAASRILAEIHLRRGAYDRALDACDDALRVNPNAPSALLTLARVYRAQGDAGMTREIATRLKLLWKDADPDFRELPALEELLRAFPPAS